MTVDTVITDDSTPRVRVVTLNRPERMNALDGATLASLNAAVRSASEPGRDIRVLVIRGTGRAFCAGNDLKWLASGVLADPAAHQRHQDLMQDTYEFLESARQIVIASINGFAVAGGTAPVTKFGKYDDTKLFSDGGTAPATHNSPGEFADLRAT